MELSGKIIAVLEKKSGVAKATGNPWASQSYVLETHEAYPRKMCFEIFGEEKISQFNIQAGEELTVSFDIDAREYQGRWYNSIRAWKVERTPAAGVAAPAPADMPPMDMPPVNFSNSGNSTDDLPF